MKKKKLAFVIYSMLSGGAERVVSILSNKLIEQYDISIIILVDSPSFYKLHPKVTLLHSTVKPKSTKNIFEAVNFNYKTYKSILKILRNEQIDLCISFMTSNNILATLAAKRKGIPVVISERNNPYVQSSSTTTFWKILRRIVYPISDILVVQTNRVKTFYTPFIKDSKIITIPNPINPSFNCSKNIIKENIILNVGSLEKQKGHDILIQAFAKSNLVDWKLYIIGEGSLRPQLTRTIQQLNLDGKVELLGKISDIEDYYKRSKIFAFSSRFEGFPNALLEAMYFGLACISTNCPTGPGEIIKNGVDGYLIPVDDVTALTNKLNLLSKNDELRIEMGTKAKVAVRPYNANIIIQNWKQVIESLLSQSY